MAPQEQAVLFNFFRYRGKGFPLPLRPFSPQGGDIAAQLPDNGRQAIAGQLFLAVQKNGKHIIIIFHEIIFSHPPTQNKTSCLICCR